MEHITAHSTHALHGVVPSRALEQSAAAALPPHTLMARAGQACARWLRALYPHARSIWIACGPGNNGGDGLVLACELQAWARSVGARLTVSWTGPARTDLPPDAAWALQMARNAGIAFSDGPPPDTDCAVDALLGLGARTIDPADPSALGHWQRWLLAAPCPVLCIDLPSGLDADTGTGPVPGLEARRHTLSLLTLKPGLFTAQGRDAAGDIWFDDLGIDATAVPPTASLNGFAPQGLDRVGPHAAHKGTQGDVTVLGGQHIAIAGAGMTGAALLAARAALNAGAGRVFVGLVEPDGQHLGVDPVAPELMFRQPAQLLASGQLARGAVVCGCGGGDAIASALDTALTQAHRLVLDADALNLLAGNPARLQAARARAAQHWATVVTPHPAEAARLLQTDVASVQRDRLRAACELAQQFQGICILKGSGTVVAAPGHTPLINTTGNVRLATGGTGDVLAGLLGAALASGTQDFWVACAEAVHRHGLVASQWQDSDGPLTASALATRLGGVRA